MVWFRVDDQFYGSKEVMAIPAEHRAAAVGMWTLAGAWSSAHLTDGFVPTYMLETFGGTAELAALLVRPARLWTRKRDGFVFRNWEKWQITRQEVEKTRQAERDRKAAYRQKRQQNTGDVPGGVPVGQIRIPDTPTLPIPTQPNPLKEEGAKRGSRIPDVFDVTPTMSQWAKTNTPTVDIRRATEKFVNYWTAKSGAQAVKLDWAATWRNWMLNESERATPRSSTAPTTKAQKNADKYHELYGDTNERTRSIQAPHPGIS